MERKKRGEFVRADGVSSGEMDIYVSETRRGPNEPGVDDLRGWAPNVDWKFAAPMLVGDMQCDLAFDGRKVRVSLRGKDTDGDLTLRFERV
jgi:hypothetical protein